MKIARIYMRVSTEEQNLERQSKLVQEVKDKGFYVAAIYHEKVSGLSTDRPELQRLIKEIQKGDWLFAESIDRITRLPPLQAEELINQITQKGAKIQVPEIFDFDELKPFIHSNEDVSLIMEPLLELLQKIFCRMALNMAHNEWLKRKGRQKEGIQLAKENGKYKGRKPNLSLHQEIIELRKKNVSIRKVAQILKTSESTVLRISKLYRNSELNFK